MNMLHFYQTWFNSHPFYFIAFASFVGICLGSFMALVGSRYPRIYEANLLQQCLEFLVHKKSLLIKDKQIEDYMDKNIPGLAFPGSFCDMCSKKLKWYENIPLIGYLRQLGKCSCSKFKIPMSFFLTELIFGFVAGSVAHKFGFSVDALLWLIFWFFMGCLFWIDAKSKWLPETFIEPITFIGLIGIFLHVSSLPSLTEGVATALTIYLSLKIIVSISSFILKKEGMGMGDLQLYAVIAIWIGYHHILHIVILSCFLGIIFGILYKRKHQEDQFPFGPSIIAAAYIIWLISSYIPEFIK